MHQCRTCERLILAVEITVEGKIDGGLLVSIEIYLDVSLVGQRRPDSPNHRRAFDLGEDLPVSLFADDTAGLMDALELPGAHILGFSMGGYIAQELALNYPNKVKKLILASTGCGGDRAVLMSPERLEKFQANAGLKPEEILRKDMDIYFSDEFVEHNPDDIEEFIGISMRYYQPADAFLRQFDACLRHDTVDRLNSIAVPALIMTGDDDPLVPPENSNILKELIPHAEQFVFTGGRHCVMIEKADQYNQKVIDFFKTNS